MDEHTAQLGADGALHFRSAPRVLMPGGRQLPLYVQVPAMVHSHLSIISEVFFSCCCCSWKPSHTLQRLHGNLQGWPSATFACICLALRVSQPLCFISSIKMLLHYDADSGGSNTVCGGAADAGDRARSDAGRHARHCGAHLCTNLWTSTLCILYRPEQAYCAFKAAKVVLMQMLGGVNPMQQFAFCACAAG